MNLRGMFRGYTMMATRKDHDSCVSEGVFCLRTKACLFHLMLWRERSYLYWSVAQLASELIPFPLVRIYQSVIYQSRRER